MEVQVMIGVVHDDGAVTNEYRWHPATTTDYLGDHVAAAFTAAREEFPEDTMIALDLTITAGS